MSSGRGETEVDRRRLLRTLGGAAGLVAWPSGTSWAATDAVPYVEADWLARPPEGFQPLDLPGVVTKAEARGDFGSIMQPNRLWPRADIARRLLERVLTDLTGAPSLSAAMRRFVHPRDVVAIKVNGIAGQNGYTMAVNFELIAPLVEALLEIGVAADKLTIYEQFPAHLAGTRVNVAAWKLPEGVRTATHDNKDHVMPRIPVYRNVLTRYCRVFTDATAVIDLTMMKEHHICGITGAMKNITHGTIDNPHHHHDNQASPQIALLYGHPIVQSRVRLHVADAFKIIYDKGPLDEDPRMRVPHGAVYASTDAVALDTIAWQVIEAERKRRGGMTLERAGRKPRYLERAAELGVGVHDPNLIRLKSATI
ncbi:MAG TPA: DUF362 domain-containing protein [Polyangiaceae bacterium]|nr:DUF362 domain-containing protein [Polyangiaceae bacterium]